MAAFGPPPGQPAAPSNETSKFCPNNRDHLNAGKPPEIARDVAKGHAVKVAKEYGVQLPKLVTDRLEEQIRKHYGRAPGKNQSMLYSCVVH
jgi:hypothetical protein